MARTLTANQDAAIASVDTETHDLMEITLPVYGEAPVVYYVATAEVVIDEQLYARSLRSIPQITYSRGESASDGGEFTLENLSNTFGPLFLNQARPLDGATVVIKRAFRVTPQNMVALWEVDEIARGKMRITKVTEEVAAALFISDLSDPTALIGGEALTQRCILVFNKGGLAPTDLTLPCGWLLAQGGNPLACDRIYDSANGCLGHNNQHRFGGVPPLAVTAATVSSGGPIGIVPGGGGGPILPGGYPTGDDHPRRDHFDVIN